MRQTILVMALIAAVFITAPVFAELQNVWVGGELRVRGNFYTSGTDLSFDNDGGDGFEFIEQRTKLNVTADFTDDVTAFIEMDSYSDWGSDTRAADPFGTNAGDADGDIDLHQGYIEMRESWGQPLTIRVGRQEIILGNEWLVGNNDTASNFTGLSYDAVSARWDFNGGNVFAFASKVYEGENTFTVFTDEDDGDADLYGIYGTYDGLDNHTFEGYYFYYRDAFPASPFSGVAGSTDDSGHVSTIGARAYGSFSGIGYDVQLAYQQGNPGEGIPPLDLDIEAFAFDGTLSYTFENFHNLMIWGGVAYFEGGDGGEAAFMRLFSDVEYSEFLADSDMSNVIILRGGASIQATESVGISGVLSWFEEEEEATGTDEGLGVELGIYLSYDYSEDLNFNAGWAHFFTDDDVEDGFIINASGTAANAPTLESDDLDYFFVESSISF